MLGGLAREVVSPWASIKALDMFKMRAHPGHSALVRSHPAMASGAPFQLAWVQPHGFVN
jgi:hypothetical protein